jgi:phosphoribosylformylglycinamidine (FGAM) synthase-like amidotransferase family enzyme
LTWNQIGRFQNRWVRLAVTGEPNIFFRGIEQLELPVAHAEGRFVARDATTLQQLDQAGQIVLRYARVEGDADPGVSFDGPCRRIDAASGAQCRPDTASPVDASVTRSRRRRATSVPQRRGVF